MFIILAILERENTRELTLLQITIHYVFLLVSNDLIVAIRGTPNYLSPELWKIYSKKLEKGHFNPLKADVYALGIVLLQ